MKLKTTSRRFLLPTVTATCLILAGIPLQAGILFTEGFETPDITGYVQGNTPATKWVRAVQGFNAGFHGLIDQDVDGAGVGLEFTAPSTQGYAFRYTNSGLTSAASQIGAIRWGFTYTVSVDVVKDIVGTTGRPYTIQLIAFAPGAARDDIRSTPTGSTVVASAGGNAPADGTVQTVTFNFTPNPVTQAGLVGYDLGVRFIGASDSANIDNVQVSATDPPIAYWDTNGATAGAGGPAATGTWDGALNNWNPAADGTGTSAPWLTGQAFFAAGTDASDPYTVTVDGSRDINLLGFEEGTVSLANGTSGALNLTGDTPATVASGLTATIAPPITQDATPRQLIKLGAGTLTLSGNSAHTGATTVVQGTLLLSGTDNSAATGGMALNGGLTRFNTLTSINGTTRNVTLNAGGTLAFEPAFGVTDIPTALSTRIVATSAGTIAADNYAAENFDFNTPGLTAAYLGAAGSVSYSGTLTPNGTTYRIGGGSGTLTMANTNALAGATSAQIRGNVVLAGANNHSAGTTLNAGGNLTLGNDSSLGGGTFTISGASTVQASSAVVATNTIAANADFTLAGSAALTLSGATTINANRIITNTNTTATTTFGAISRDGSNNRNLTVNGAGNTTVTGNLVLGTGTLTKNDAGYLTLEGANNYSGTTTINGGRLILKGSNSTAGATTLILNQLHLASASNGGLPSGAVTFGNGTQFNAIIQAVDDDRAITNNLVLNNAHGSISGDYSLTVNGSFTNSGGNRTLTNSIVAGKSLTLAGQVNLSNDATNRTLTVTGTGSTLISGQVVNGSTSTAGVLTKTGTGTLTLSNNTNSYGGATNVSAGKLFINGDQTTATGAVNVTGTGVLGGTGIIGGTTSIANTCGLEFNLSTAPGTHNKLELAAAKTLTFSGASVLTITSSGGATIGLYTLVTAPGASSIIGLVPASVNLPVGWLADPPQIVVDGLDTSLQINITSTGGGGPGPVDHFDISAIGSPQTVGTAITGITLTARDASNAVATGFTGTVTFGGTGGFTGTSASFTAGVLSGVSVTPTVAGSNLTFTVDDGATHTGSTTITTIQTQYEAWAGGALFDADANGDGVDNGLAFLLGASGPSAAVTLPVITQSSGNLVMTFNMRNSANRGPASLRVQHSSNLGISDPWSDSDAVTDTPGLSPAVNGVTFNVTPGSPLNGVVATVWSSEAASGKLFGRLKGQP